LTMKQAGDMYRRLYMEHWAARRKNKFNLLNIKKTWDY